MESVHEWYDWYNLIFQVVPVGCTGLFSFLTPPMVQLVQPILRKKSYTGGNI